MEVSRAGISMRRKPVRATGDAIDDHASH